MSQLRRRLLVAELRALYESAPSAELAAALWQLHYAHKTICELFRKMEKGCRQPELAENMCRFGAFHIADEPCIKALLDADWARRADVGGRYYEVRHLSQRPDYRPPGPIDQGAQNLGDRAARLAAERGEPPPLPLGAAGTVLRPGNRYIPK